MLADISGMSTMDPGYKHDCDDCEFLGNVSGTHPRMAVQNPGQVVYDLYYCKNCDGGTYIARYSSEGSNYSSCPKSMLTKDTNPAVLWAYALHTMKGLATPLATTAPDPHTPNT